MTNPISRDIEAAAAASADWRAYAAALEAHGATPHVPLSEVAVMVGDVYAPYAAAKAAEYAARADAYRRAADHARAHAAKGDHDSAVLSQADADSARRITSAVSLV